MKKGNQLLRKKRHCTPAGKILATPMMHTVCCSSHVCIYGNERAKIRKSQKMTDDIKL